jgi:hypothetical protein
MASFSEGLDRQSHGKGWKRMQRKIVAARVT